MTKKEIYERLKQIYKQGKQTGDFASSLYNLIADMTFDVEEKNTKRETQMTVYAVIYTVGFFTGHKELIGIYSSKDKAEIMKQVDIKRSCRIEWNYSIKPIDIDKTVNKIYQEW